MNKNIGSLDAAVRILLAITFAVLFFTHVITGTWAAILLVLAAVLLLTSLVGVCPLYLPFGISTRREKNVQNIG